MLELSKFPVFLYFKNGNTYSGSENGMRYFIRQDKRSDPEDESGKKKIPYLTVCAWPEPWSVENTDPALTSTAEFAPNEEGFAQAVAWLQGLLKNEPERWANRPSILDCEPWKPTPPEEDAPPFDL